VTAARWRTGLLLVALAAVARVAWVLVVPTVAVGDFATYRESARYLAETGQLDPGFVYMPGLVLLLAALHRLGGELLADKLLCAAFGALATAPIYVLGSRLGDGDDGGGGDGDAGARRRPVALIGGLAYALWPAGIAMSSVVGTDVPAAALIALALALLAALGPARPRTAAVAFGAAMGLAAYFRAVALPLALLSFFYWLARRTPARAVVARTALAVAATVLVLGPWALRNQRASGELHMTDSHGGVTALMGNDPNTEGTYSRSLGIMFRELTGKSFISQPHRDTDRAAYALVRRWVAFEPAFALGMVAMRTERLFAAERGLLYWPVYRRGALPEGAVTWWDGHWRQVTGLVDLFYWALIVGVAAGVAFAFAERRWLALVPLPFAAALATTYVLFVAEPRYRITTEVLLFPVAALGWHRLGGVARAGVRLLLGAAPGPGRDGLHHRLRGARRGLLGTALVLAAIAGAGLLVVRGGAALRDRHRWAATVWRIDGRAAQALWRRADRAGGPSPVRGAPAGAVLRLAPGARAAVAEIALPESMLPAGRYHLGADLEWQGEGDAGLRLALAGGAAPATERRIEVTIDHPGGPLGIGARLERDREGPSASVFVGSVTVGRQ
jgi:4-amino-4-deoxy-L-arabinose transferase-like glycosyltransferase